VLGLELGLVLLLLAGAAYVLFEEVRMVLRRLMRSPLALRK
jgi:hypothetical protein